MGSTQESKRRMGACRGWVPPGVGGRGALSTSLAPSFHPPQPVLLRVQQSCPPKALGQGELQRGLQTPAEVFAWEVGV